MLLSKNQPSYFDTRELPKIKNLEFKDIFDINSEKLYNWERFDSQNNGG